MIYSKIANQAKFPFILPNLPYTKDSLTPHYTTESFEYHHEKHHNTYVVNLNNLLENHEFKELDLETIIFNSHKNSHKPIFNNAAQIWNHTFFWHSMKQNGGGMPSNDVMQKITTDFGSFQEFKDIFKKTGASQFGSGWVWLVFDKTTEILKIISSSNAETPITEGLIPLCTCDVWEHAYYIDFRNRRPDYLSIFLEHLINWDFVESNYKQALSF
jgi:Fe-Mn family superoxide dismutase